MIDSFFCFVLLKNLTGHCLMVTNGFSPVAAFQFLILKFLFSWYGLFKKFENYIP